MYHINPKTGNPGVCRATRSCPFGDLDTEHYADKDSARAAYENKQAGAFGDGVVTVRTDEESFELDTRKFINSDESVKGRASNLDRSAVLKELTYAPDLPGYEPNAVTADRFKAWWSGAGVTREDYDVMWDVLHDVAEGAAQAAAIDKVPGAKKLVVRATRVRFELENEWQEAWD